jgi:hypothetical protein
MKIFLKMILIVMLLSLFSTFVYADRGEYKKLNQRIALLYKNGKFLEAIEVAKRWVI